MKTGVIPDVLLMTKVIRGKDGSQELTIGDELASYQLVGRVMAYQGF